MDNKLQHFQVLIADISESELNLYDAIFGGDEDVQPSEDYQFALDALMALADD